MRGSEMATFTYEIFFRVGAEAGVAARASSRHGF